MIKMEWKKEILSIPNLLSLFRLLLIPVYATIYLNAAENWHYIVAGVILAISCITDMLDGFIARRFNMITHVGMILDPIADKATQLTLILCLASRYAAMWFVIVLFLIKETFQFSIGAVYLKKGKMLDGALISGKVCTTVLFTSFTLLVLLPGMEVSLANILIAMDFVFMLIAFGDYFMAYVAAPQVTDMKTLEEENK